MDLAEFLASLCRRMKEFFYFSFGDSRDTVSTDVTLPDIASVTGWQQVISIPRRSILLIRNMDLANEAVMTFNDSDILGFPIPADTIMLLDSAGGTLFMKCAAAGVTVNIRAQAIPCIRIAD